MRFGALFILGALITPLFANANPVILNCTSYSGRLQLQVTLERTGGELAVANSTESQTVFGLDANQTIELGRYNDIARGWTAMVGVSNRKQEIKFKTQTINLTRSGSFEAFLLVSSDWDTSTEVSNQLTCTL